MGKYIRKSKIDGDATAMMDVSPSSLGVLTRAQSLALQRRLHKPSASSSLPTSLSPNPPSKQKQQITDFGGSYLQLRSRRLPKNPSIVFIRSNKRSKQRRRTETCGQNPNPNPHNLDSLIGSTQVSLGDGSRSDSVAESAVCGKEKALNCEINKNPCVETSFGENFLEGSESVNRSTRESTPSSLIRKPEIITSSGAATKLNNAISNQREESLSGSHCHLPTTPEMDEFFSGAEEAQRKQFIDKYNFDPVNEQPLPGRFEWTKVDD